MVDILREIVDRRRRRLAGEGHALGCVVPAQRSVPLAPMACSPDRPLVICEIKRRSPSRGVLSATLDPVVQAGRYRAAAVRAVSVLTEEDHFSGSLGDLMAVKAAYPQLAVLRKDFLLDIEDIEVSYRAGADAVLLIAGVLDPAALAAMHQRAAQLGMAALVEVHDAHECAAVRALRPPLIGMNARDLVTFAVDTLQPLRVARGVDWPAQMVFESGIFSGEQAAYAGRNGFCGILVGEAVVKDPELPAALTLGLRRGVAARTIGLPAARPAAADAVAASAVAASAVAADAVAASAIGRVVVEPFWRHIARRLGMSAASTERVAATAGAPGVAATETVAATGSAAEVAGRPLVKICGITNADDARRAADLGADLLGFVFAPSKRRADRALLRAVAEVALPKVAVVVAQASTADDLEAVDWAVAEGLIDVVQFHGSETPEQCGRWSCGDASLATIGRECRGECSPATVAENVGVPSAAAGRAYYKALRPQSDADLAAVEHFRCPRVLLDAYTAAGYGGSGARVDEAVIRAWRAQHRPLWVAGGLNPDTVGPIIRRHRPELIDCSSGVEVDPGRKDPQILARYFQEVQRAGLEPSI